MALTASSPPAFERETVNSLVLGDAVVVREQLNRPSVCRAFIVNDYSLSSIFRETCLH